MFVSIVFTIAVAVPVLSSGFDHDETWQIGFLEGRNVLVKTYDRHEYAVEKRDALERWALRLREITEPPPENVVKLGAKR